jgi:hypothetical protein
MHPKVFFFLTLLHDHDSKEDHMNDFYFYISWPPIPLDARIKKFYNKREFKESMKSRS